MQFVVCWDHFSLRLGGKPHRLVELVRKLVQTRLRRIKGSGFMRVHVDDKGKGAAQIVEHDDLFGHHQKNIRRADIVLALRRSDTGFHVTHGVIAEVSYQSAGKALVARCWRDTKARLELIDKFEGIRALMLFSDFAIRLHRHH